MPTGSRRALSTLVVATGLAALALHATAAPVRTDHVEAELVSAQSALAPGQPATLALRLKIQDGWHTYWRNPGDSGLPTTLDWKLPSGFAAGAIEWPAPKALPAGPLVNYGYEGEVLHLVPLTVPGDAKVGAPVTLAARADWLVCRETCIPDGADLSLTLPVAAAPQADGRWQPRIAATEAALPRALDGWTVSAEGKGANIALTLRPTGAGGHPGDLRFFPNDEGRVEPSAPQAVARTPDGAWQVMLPVASQLTPFDRVAGVVTSSRGFATPAGLVHAAALDVPLTGSVVAGPKPKLDAPVLSLAPEGISGAPVGPSGVVSLWTAAFLAFIGGLVLNLMPCVFPVLSLKALSLAAPGHDDRRTLRLQGFAFAAGVVLTFVALAGALLVLRAAGQQLGWGFQLQSPAVVTGLAVLFFILALNLSGVFEFATLVPSAAAGWTARNPYVDAVASGVLAVVIASPCTAPFMGAALGFAIAQPPVETLAVFVALGLGMALPFVLLSAFPAWRRLLPRPGAWMERLKQLLAFPLYGTVAWLAWVLGAQVDNDAVVRLLATLVVVAFGLWCWRAYRGGGARGWSVAALAGLAGAIAIGWPLVNGAKEAEAAVARSASAGTDATWQPFSPQKVAELASAGRPVFVDFTAAWCVTCQVNKRLVLNTANVRAAFAARDVALVRADWTRRDPVITAALGTLGRNGVPVYVLYRPGKAPLVLPEVLHAQIVVDALATL
jgi:thiol:disulfide interchange protein/DsbC/DsbD-like thiol-disulfide interchange protein